MDGLVKIQLTSDIILTPAIKKAVGCFGIPPAYENYHLVGKFLVASPISNMATVRFRVLGVLHSGIPIAKLDEVITLTMTRSAVVQSYPSMNAIEVYKVKNPFIRDGVCFNRGEEVVLHKGKITTLLVNGLEVRVRSSFVSTLRFNSKRKQLFSVIYPQAFNWLVVGIFAYTMAEAADVLVTEEPHLFTDALPVGHYTTEQLLRVSHSITYANGMPSTSLDTIRRIKAGENVEHDDGVVSKWLEMNESKSLLRNLQ